jgi:hypothetical protein
MLVGGDQGKFGNSGLHFPLVPESGMWLAVEIKAVRQLMFNVMHILDENSLFV